MLSGSTASHRHTPELPPTCTTESDEIRVLQLGEAKEECQLPTATLLHVRLSDRPSFSALSYVWRVETDPCPLWCDGGRFRITKNLGHALRHLQYHEEGERKLFWIDALCINQDDVPERNHQVTLMKDIYGAASEVLIWFGPDLTKKAPVAFESIRYTIWELREAIECGVEPDQTDSWLEQEEAGKRLQEAAPLLHCEWFTRTWTIQEAGLNESATARWGSFSLPFNYIGLFCMLYVKHFRAIAGKFGLDAELDRAANLFTMYLPTPGARRLHQVLHLARPYLATDSRDKVYALISHPPAADTAGDTPYLEMKRKDPTELCEDAVLYRNLAFILSPGRPSTNHDTRVAYIASKDLNHPPRAPSPDSFSAQQILQWKSDRVYALPRFHRDQKSFVEPHYDQSVVSVYRDVAMKMIKRTNSLEVLTFVSHEDNLPPSGLDFPSWIPRWDVQSDPSPLGLAPGNHFAAANRRPVITPCDDPGALIVQGILFDGIASSTPTLSRRDFLDPSVTSPVFSMATHCWLDKAPFPEYPYIRGSFTRTDRMRAYLKTWTAGNLSSLWGEDADFHAYQREFIETQIKAGRSSEQQLEVLVNILSTQGFSGDAKRFATAVADACHGRRFFTTRCGMFGIGPGILEENDVVAVLLGHDVPVVLREKSKVGHN